MVIAKRAEKKKKTRYDNIITILTQSHITNRGVRYGCPSRPAISWCRESSRIV